VISFKETIKLVLKIFTVGSRNNAVTVTYTHSFEKIEKSLNRKSPLSRHHWSDVGYLLTYLLT